MDINLKKLFPNSLFEKISLLNIKLFFLFSRKYIKFFTGTLTHKILGETNPYKFSYQNTTIEQLNIIVPV